MVTKHKSSQSVHSSRLLALDSSAHLHTYRGSLGPYRTSPVTADVPVVEATRWSPVPVTNPSVTADQIPSNISDIQPHDDPKLMPYKPYLRTSWTCKMMQPSGMVMAKGEAPAVQLAAPTVQMTAPTTQVIANRYNVSRLPSTIPPPLRYALEHCNARSAHVKDPATVYQVIEDTKSAYRDDNTNIVGIYSDLHHANEAAVSHFFDGGFLTAGLDAPEIKVLVGGMISCGVATDGSMAGYTTVFVRMARIR
jgi:hypothetical protein